MSRGLYFVIEACDGAGKSNLIEGLYESLRDSKVDVIKTFEFGSTNFGKVMREFFYSFPEDFTKHVYKDSVGFLYLADHLAHIEQLVRPSLEGGKVVLQDRFYPISQQVYSEEGVDNASLIAHEIVHKNCVQPDLVILLTIDPELALDRARKRGDSKFAAKPWSNLESYRRIHNRYLALAKDNPLYFVLDVTNLSKQEVSAIVSKKVLDAIYK